MDMDATNPTTGHNGEAPSDAPPGVAMFATASCPHCSRAEHYLASRGAGQVRKTFVDKDPSERIRMSQLSGGRRTVPQIFIAGFHVGGCDDLIALGSSNPELLAELIAKASRTPFPPVA